MPNVAVVAGKDHHPPGISRQFEYGTQRTDPIDRPIVPNLLSATQPVVDGVEDNADDLVVCRENRLAEIVADNPSGPFRDFLLVEQHRGIPLVADVLQGRVRLEVAFLDRRIAFDQLARQQGRAGIGA